MQAEAIRIDRVADHSFLSAPITPGSVVVDLGVNTGSFAMSMIEAYGCRVVGVEPVPQLYAALPKLDRLAVDPMAITSHGASAKLYLNQSRCATIEDALSQSGAQVVDVEGITLAGLLDRHRLERAPLVKVDIEGAELAMIGASTPETLQRVDQFTIEFHDFLDPDLAEPVAWAKRRLRSVGFAELGLSRDNSDVLFVNRATIRFGTARMAAAALAYKYPRGIGRMSARWAQSLAQASDVHSAPR